MTTPQNTYNSRTDLSIGQVPDEIVDPILYQELLDIHNALESTLNTVGRVTAEIPLYSYADVLNNGVRDITTGEITLNLAAYTIAGNIDLINDFLRLQGGTSLRGYTSFLSSIVTDSPEPLITVEDSFFRASNISGDGGLRLDNLTGPCIKVTGPATLLFTSNLFTSIASIALILDGVAGYAMENWTLGANVINGAVLTGTNPRTIMKSFNAGNTLTPIQGIAIDIQGPMTGPLLLELPIIVSTGQGIRCNQSIQGIGITDGSIASTASKGIEFTGSTIGAIRISGARVAGGFSAPGDGHAFDISGANKVGSITVDDSNLFAIGAGNACFATDADSGDNIDLRGEFSNTSFIAIIGANALDNATKKDIKLKFVSCFGNTTPISDEVSDSITFGCFTLDAEATTTIGAVGDNGLITAFASGGVGITIVSAAGHTAANGDPVAIFTTTSYNGLFTVSNVVPGVSFEIARAFVADDATGNWELGWVKINGTTIDCPTIERFIGSGDNEQQHLAIETTPLTYNASITGRRTAASANVFEFALFCDDGNGEGFVKVNGSIPQTLVNVDVNVGLRIPTSAGQGEVLTSFTRNMTATNDLICSAFTVDISRS